VRRHGGQAQGGAQADAMKVCLRERSPCSPASQPAPSAD
jgi:hypothetical protein